MSLRRNTMIDKLQFWKKDTKLRRTNSMRNSYSNNRSIFHYKIKVHLRMVKVILYKTSSNFSTNRRISIIVFSASRKNDCK